MDAHHDSALVQRYVPEFEKRWNKYSRPVGGSWRCDETDISAGMIARRIGVRSCKYLNNVVEQDHRRIKQRIRPMLGFKRFQTVATTISGIELVEEIRKKQFKTGNLPGRPATAPDICAAILAA